jgi:hypothetical protein
LNNSLFTKTRTERQCFAGYVITASVLMILVVLLQYFKYNLFGTTLMLGWDTPSYVWTAKLIIAHGPTYVIDAWGYPYLYTFLLAFFGYLTGDVVMVERILPIVFGVLLIWANSELSFRIAKNVHIAGLAAILSAISANTLRILSDFNRNLMALSLSMVALLLVPYFEERKSFIDRRYLSFILLLFIIAITQLETFSILCLSLVLCGIFSKSLKKLFKFALACAIPVAILVSLFPSFFSGYLGMLVYFEELTAIQIILLTIGSWIILGLVIVGSYLFFKSKLKNKRLFAPIFSWSLVLLALISLIGAGIVHLPEDFAYRSAIILPVPVLSALAVQGCNDHISRHQWTETSSSNPNRRSLKAALRRSLPFLLAFLLLGSSLFLTIQYADGFLTPYIPRSGYEKMIETRQFLAKSSPSIPVFVFRGDPPIHYVGLYRNYLGADIGEHFAYYGDVEKLFQFIRSSPEINYDPYLAQWEKYYINFYFDEMLGNFSEPPPPLYVHNCYITNLTELMSHPIVIITPEFYNQEIPYNLKPFYLGDGIYIIPPNSRISFTKASQGPEITVKDNAPFKVSSTYPYIDSEDPSIICLGVNACNGYISYNFTSYPADWAFRRIERGGDISLSEVN